MDIQIAKEIYFKLKQDWELFVTEYRIGRHSERDERRYLIQGLFLDIVPYLSSNEQKKLSKALEQFLENEKNYSETREDFRKQVEDNNENQFLTSRQKERLNEDIRNKAEAILMKMVEKNRQDEEVFLKTIEPVSQILSEVRNTLNKEVDWLNPSINLYDFHITAEVYVEEFLDKLYRPEPELKYRDWEYYNKRTNEHTNYQKHMREADEEYGFNYLLKSNEYEKQEKIRKMGYSSEVEFYATEHENRKEKEELAYIEKLKAEQTYTELKKQPTLIDKLLGRG